MPISPQAEDPGQSSQRRYHAVVLAGRRGPGDPLAAAAGAPHRALLDIRGVPMLERVFRTLEKCPWIAEIRVSIDEPALLEAIPTLADAISAGSLQVSPTESSPSRSVLAALDRTPPEDPVLVTTADHALLSGVMLEHFLSRADGSGADLAVAMVSETVLRARFPESKRTYLRFRGESYSGANLFAFRTPEARRAAEFWRRAEQFRKQPWRLASAFGLSALLLFALRLLDLEAAMARASRAIGARVTAVEMPMAEAAVDVDKMDDLELVNRILADSGAGS